MKFGLMGILRRGTINHQHPAKRPHHVNTAQHSTLAASVSMHNSPNYTDDTQLNLASPGVFHVYQSFQSLLVLSFNQQTTRTWSCHAFNGLVHQIWNMLPFHLEDIDMRVIPEISYKVVSFW